MTTKQRILRAMEELPEDTTVEAAIERLLFVSQLERRLDELNEGRSISHEEALRRLDKWLS
jgi:hypothetical protein